MELFPNVNVKCLIKKSIIMKIVKIVSTNLEQAKSQVIEDRTFTNVVKNATRSWEKAGEPEINTNEFIEWAKEYTNTVLKNGNGMAAYVQLTKAVENKNKRPYSFENISNKVTRKFQTIYAIIANEDGKEVLIGRVTGSKADAEDFVREYYKQGGKASVNCEVMHQVKREEGCGEPLAFRAEYKTAAKESAGEYVFLGEPFAL